MAGTTNTQLLNAIHELDKKLVNHLGLITGQGIKIEELRGDVYDHDEGGIKYQNKLMWAERKEKKGMTNEIKMAIIISVINGLMTAGSIFNII